MIWSVRFIPTSSQAFLSFDVSSLSSLANLEKGLFVSSPPAGARLARVARLARLAKFTRLARVARLMRLTRSTRLARLDRLMRLARVRRGLPDNAI